MSSTYRDTDLAGVVLGSYRIVSEISTGGMGTVYRAQHTLLDRTAAIKLLRPQLTANGELVERFFREARAASAIQHPGIIEVFDFGFADGRAYLVMELLDGQPLGERLHTRGGRLGEIEVAQIGRGIASALTAAHAKGIIHRDLKPDNVFLVPDPDLPSGERPKLLDFGIAKLADGAGSHQTQTGALIGTPLYMAPEQARAAATIDARADLYSLGCILYELLVGEPPFVATGAGEIIAMHMFTPPQPPSQRVSVSRELEAIVMRLLDKDPRARFHSADEVAEALAGIGGFASSGRRLPQLASGPFAQVPSPPRPRKRSTRAFVAVAVALAIVVVFAVVIATRPDDEPSAPAVAQPPRAQPPRAEPPPRSAPSEPVVVEGARKPPDVQVVHKQIPADAGAGRPAAIHASETKVRTESGSPVETDVGEMKKNHKPLDNPPP